eukprot:SAG11_NODE_704_length_7657_cov_38.765943_4_plen_63_part_00
MDLFFNPTAGEDRPKGAPTCTAGHTALLQHSNSVAATGCPTCPPHKRKIELIWVCVVYQNDK